MPLYCVSTVLVSVVRRRPISIITKVYIAVYMVERLHLQHVKSRNISWSDEWPDNRSYISEPTVDEQKFDLTSLTHAQVRLHTQDMTTPISQKRVSRHQLPAGHVAVSDKLQGSLLHQELTKCNIVLIKAQIIFIAP